MISAVKHGKPKILDNICPFYITTNEVTYFGNDEENVKRRIRVFKIKLLESCLTNVDRWIRDNPMDCIVWIAQVIEENIELVMSMRDGMNEIHLFLDKQTYTDTGKTTNLSC